MEELGLDGGTTLKWILMAGVELINQTRGKNKMKTIVKKKRKCKFWFHKKWGFLE